MAALIVKHRVANYESWKTAFDGMKSIRAKHGWISTHVFRDATDPNMVTIVNRVRDLAGAKAYGSSPELRGAMEKGGVLGPPEIHFVDDAGDDAY